MWLRNLRPGRLEAGWPRIPRKPDRGRTEPVPRTCSPRGPRQRSGPTPVACLFSALRWWPRIIKSLMFLSCKSEEEIYRKNQYWLGKSSLYFREMSIDCSYAGSWVLILLNSYNVCWKFYQFLEPVKPWMPRFVERQVVRFLSFVQELPLGRVFIQIRWKSWKDSELGEMFLGRL